MTRTAQKEVPMPVPNDNTPEYVDDRQLAQRTPISRVTWQEMRIRREGPPYYKVGSRCLYKLSEVERWLASQAARVEQVQLIERTLADLDNDVRAAMGALRCPGRLPRGFVYALRCDVMGLVKIGMAMVDPVQRIGDLARMNAAPLRLLGLGHGGHLETELHRRYVNHRRHGEWFAIDHNPLEVIGDVCATCRDFRRRAL